MRTYAIKMPQKAKKLRMNSIQDATKPIVSPALKPDIRLLVTNQCIDNCNVVMDINQKIMYTLLEVACGPSSLQECIVSCL